MSLIQTLYNAILVCALTISIPGVGPIFISSADVELVIEEFNITGGRVPLLANLKPHGKVIIPQLISGLK